MEDFYHEIMKCDLSDVPVVAADLADTWIHGVGSYLVEVSAARAARRQVAGLEAALTLLGTAEEMDLRDIAGIYERLSRFGEHTWGLDVKTWLPARVRVYEKRASVDGQLLEQPGASAAGRILNANGTSFTGWARNCSNTDMGMALFGGRYLFANAAQAVQVLAYMPDPAGGLLRLRDTSGKAREMEIVCSQPGGRLQECDIYGKPVAGVISECLRLLVLHQP